ncbi:MULTISPECIES: methionine--tRNA ligase [unclassified Prochlorococcus]|uniref:methionine--tRNA ligase n=1 Tax=unclassified Prochlorococcus TaxID=2627481 RepID=UPI0005338484|nr:MULTISPECIES: methionine--tRNA ligase [unclassified Prochlorococcus]KGG15291.1 Methionyl-tRNA synthetase [Prochlorococcus sp. MIT 0602]KGG17569.1 Methionyl-tRNA synthetase [Prochlorococcus sp. MIT 0603]
MTITITTPLYYVNDKPHLGSTYTTIATDVLARFHRLTGEEVIFITGVDEHGQKIQRTAKENKISPIDHCNKVSKKYKDLWRLWSISNNRFVRTTSLKHIDLVYEFFCRVKANGDIRLGQQEGWYCVGCEEYKDIDSNIDNPTCPIHQKNLEWRDEENLFFCLSNYQEEIEEIISNPTFIQPLSRQNEIKNFVAKGLKDFSISRKNVDWGIPVPGYKGHTFYVWFDALLGYISALFNDDENIDLNLVNNKGWPADLHLIGKDILRFHAIYWPAMLMSAKLSLPRKVFGHGFLTREGQKMGKSLGNVLDPEVLLKDYGEDAIRWYLLSDFKFGQDGDYQEKRFIDLVNNDLANTIGNLLNRTSSMARKWFAEDSNSFTVEIKQNKLRDLSELTIKDVIGKYHNLYLKEACQSIINLASEANLYLNDNEPWKLIKDSKNEQIVRYHLYNVLESCRIVAILLLPIVPNLSRKMLLQLSYPEPKSNWNEDLIWGKLKSITQLPDPQPIIPKIEK